MKNAIGKNTFVNSSVKSNNIGTHYAAATSLETWGVLIGGTVYNGGSAPEKSSNYNKHGKYYWNCTVPAGFQRGKYRIEHNIGHRNYTIQMNAAPHSNEWCLSPFIVTISDTYFDVYVCHVNLDWNHIDRGRYSGFTFIVFGEDALSPVQLIPDRFINKFNDQLTMFPDLTADIITADKLTITGNNFNTFDSGILGIYCCNSGTGGVSKDYEHPKLRVTYRRTGEGRYSFTHNLNHDKWAAIGMLYFDGAADYVCVMQKDSLNSFSAHCMYGRGGQVWRDRYILVILIGQI